MAGKRWNKKSKPTMAKAKRMVTKQHKSKAKRNMDTFFFKSKVLQTIIPAQGAIVANYSYNTWTLDPSDSGRASYLNNAEFNLYRLQYDKYRVNSVRVTFLPKANVLDITSGQNDAVYNLTGDGCVHTAIDRDGPAPNSIAALSRYPSYRKVDLKKRFSRSYSIKYPTGVWIDCQNQASFPMVKELGLSGGVTIYAENFLEDNYELWNEPWASVLIEHNIVFQGKTSASINGIYDENQNLTGVTLTPVVLTTALPPTALRNVRGTLNDTRTVDEVNDVPINDAGVPLD